MQMLFNWFWLTYQVFRWYWFLFRGDFCSHFIFVHNTHFATSNIYWHLIELMVFILIQTFDDGSIWKRRATNQSCLSGRAQNVNLLNISIAIVKSYSWAILSAKIFCPEPKTFGITWHKRNRNYVIRRTKYMPCFVGCGGLILTLHHEHEIVQAYLHTIIRLFRSSS